MPIAQRLSIGRNKALCLLGGEEVEIVLANQFVSRKSEQLLAGHVEPNESEVLGILYENHVGQVFDDRVKELIRGTQLLGPLGHLRFEFACCQPLVVHQLGDRYGTRSAVREAFEQPEIVFSEGS